MKHWRRFHLVSQTLQALVQTMPIEELYQVFKKTYPSQKISLERFRLLKPWNLIKAYRETCLCRVCELFRLYMQGLHLLPPLLTPLVEDERREAQAIRAEADEDQEDLELDGAVDKDLLALIEFCKLESKTKMTEKLVCHSCNIMEADMDCVQGKCAACGFKKLWSKGLKPKLVDNNQKLHDGVSPVWEQQVRWETLRSSGSTPSDSGHSEEREALRELKNGTLIDLLDNFETASVKFPAHRHLVCDAKAKSLQRMRNFTPGILMSDFDWSENGVITPNRQIQSEYWSLTHYSLFIAITSYLVPEAWLDATSLLENGTEVTVLPEGTLPTRSIHPLASSFWAQVVSREGELYSVKSADGSTIANVARERLCRRKLHTTAFIGITDEKRHDASTTQHFLNKQFDHWMNKLDLGRFWAWIGHSDNASHFKSSQMMNFWTKRMSELPFMKACWIDFGCPGHGKGPWDGMGATMKQQLKRDMTNAKILTRSGYVTCPREVAEQLKARFQTAEWQLAHAHKSIHEINVHYSHHDEINERPLHEHAFESLVGKMTSYSYMMLARDQIARRERSCWCEVCFRQLGRHTLVPKGNVLICAGCTSLHVLPWQEQTVKDLGTGLAARRKEAQSLGARLAPELKASGFLAVQARERWSLHEDVLYRPGHFWVAQAPQELDVRKITKRETINGQPFKPGDFVIRIGRYFDRDVADDSGLTYEEWQPELVFKPSDVSCLMM